MTWIYWTISILFGVVLAYLVHKKDKQKQVPVKWLPALLRALTGTLVALLLLAPVFSGLSNEEERPTILWLQDISTSTANSLGGFRSKYQEQQQEVLSQLKKKYEVRTYGFGTTLVKDSISNYQQKATDIAAAIEAVSTQYQDKNIGAIIIASDGIYNQGNSPLFAQLAKPASIYSIALGDSTVPRDLSLTGAYANRTVALNSSFELFADVVANGLGGSQTTVSLLHQGKTIATQNLNITSNAYAGNISFVVEAKQAGVQQYTISVARTGPETNLQNNSRSVVVEVKEKKTKVLILANAPHPDIGLIKQAMKEASQFEVTTILNGAMPQNINDIDILVAYQYVPKEPVNIPTWYILGAQTTASALADIRSYAPWATLSTTRDIMPQLHATFDQFTLPVSIRAVLPKMPPLNSSVTGRGGSGHTLLSDQQANAIWTYVPGDVPVSILNGEGLWRWAIYEYKNFNNSNTTHELVQRTLSFLQVDKDKKPFMINVLKNNISDNEPAVILAELRNANGELINDPEAELSMTVNGRSLHYNFERSGNAYRLQAGLLAPGDYNLKGTVVWRGKTYDDLGLLHVSNIPMEALRTHADHDLMYQLAQKNNGVFFTQYNFTQLPDSISKNEDIKPVIHTRSENKPIIDEKWLFFLIILLASAEWSLRKFWSM